jgi:hypothetical protein
MGKQCALTNGDKLWEREKEYGRKEAARQKKGRRICVDSFTDSKHNKFI